MQKKLLIFLFLLFLQPAFATELPFYTFPLDKYDQDINSLVKPTDPDYNKPLINPAEQEKYLQDFYIHYFDSSDKGKSPWSQAYVEKTLEEKLVKQTSEQDILKSYNNGPKEDPNDKGYTPGFRPYSEKWIKDIIANMNLNQFAEQVKYQAGNRAIAVRNLNARILPTNDPYLRTFKADGSIHSHDRLQDAAIWVGTPLYVIGHTLDQQWSLVLSPHQIAWVETEGVGKATNFFVAKWQKYAKEKMVAITKTNTSVIDNKNTYRFNAYVGAVFPGIEVNENTITVLVPYADRYRNTRTVSASLSKKQAAVMPLEATPKNFAKIMAELLGRTYGWGSMYFYNDCSADLQSLYTPFGIWLPRDSGPQSKKGRADEKDSLSPEERLNYLMENGKKFTTMIHFPGHIMLYVGAYPNPNSEEHEQIAMTYQNLWALAPKDRSFRAMIGQSVLFPLLLEQPEDQRLASLAEKDKFKLIYLDKFVEE